MNPLVAQRLVVLAGAALLGLIVALAVASRRDAAADREPTFTSVPAPGGGWYEGVAAPYRPRAGRETACGVTLRPSSPGVTHPVLPCGVKIVLAHEGNEVLTEVVDRGPSVPGRDFDVTLPVAQELELRGQERIRWRYARAPDTVEG
jgi:rare lipoprotein A (peptidoglycan hydrolase)